MEKYDVIWIFTDFIMKNNLAEDEIKGAALFLEFLLATDNKK